MLHWWTRNPSRGLNKCLVYNMAALRATLWPRKINLASTPTQVKYLLTIPRRCFCCGLLIPSLYALHVCPGDFVFILDIRWAIFWERNCPLGFLLVVVWLSCRCFYCVLISLWYLGRKLLSNCIDSWPLPSFLLWCRCSHMLRISWFRSFDQIKRQKLFGIHTKE